MAWLFGNITCEQGGQGGGGSVVSILLFILYEEKYPETMQLGLAAVVSHLPQRQRSV